MIENVVYNKDRHHLEIGEGGGQGSEISVDNTTITKQGNVISVSSEVLDNIESRVIKVDGWRLTQNNFSDTDKQKLDNLQNYNDTPLKNEVSKKVDKVVGKELSSNDFTDSEKSKLAGLESSHFKGRYNTRAELEAIIGTSGDYAYLADNGTIVEQIWDAVNNAWTLAGGTHTGETPSSVKAKYESNPDTNCLTDALEANIIQAHNHSLNKDNPHRVTKTQVGLGNVDNTKDNVKKVDALNVIDKQLTSIPHEAVFKSFKLQANDVNGLGEVALGYSIGDGDRDVVYVTTIQGVTYCRTRVASAWMDKWIKVNAYPIQKGKVKVLNQTGVVVINVKDIVELKITRVTNLYCTIDVTVLNNVNMTYNYALHRSGLLRSRNDSKTFVKDETFRIEGDFYYDSRDFGIVKLLVNEDWYKCELIGDKENINYKITKE